ncbi:MAG: CDP-diacylglycerol--serine O-phosphatidyltransferase [Bacteroidota bacterium]|jgi:CDP-diacylglycerol--serine O-phosphatidyltransferase
MIAKKEIPNLITLGNLIAGCFGIVFVNEHNLTMAAYMIGLSLVLDFFDGFVARALKVESPLGVQLDSLADLVSFGVLPSLILLELLVNSCDNSCYYGIGGFYKPYIVFALVAASAYRLARFNITPSSQTFQGVPTPANAMLIGSLPLIIAFQPEYSQYVLQFNILIMYAVIMSYLLIGEFEIMSFKFKTWNWKENQKRYLFLLFSIILLSILQFAAIPVIILSFIGISFIKEKSEE